MTRTGVTPVDPQFERLPLDPVIPEKRAQIVYKGHQLRLPSAGVKRTGQASTAYSRIVTGVVSFGLRVTVSSSCS